MIYCHTAKRSSAQLHQGYIFSFWKKAWGLPGITTIN